MPLGSQLPRQSLGMDGATGLPAKCPACDNYHPTGLCPLKIAGVESCPLCGIAHYGRVRICPHINSVTQLQAMQEAIKHSTESPEIKELAKKKVTSLIANIKQKRRLEEEAKACKQNQASRQSGQPGSQFTPVQQATMNRQAAPSQTNGRGIGKENRMNGVHAPSPPYNY